jgi:hypothetical protein
MPSCESSRRGGGVGKKIVIRVRSSFYEENFEDGVALVETESEDATAQSSSNDYVVICTIGSHSF